MYAVWTAPTPPPAVTLYGAQGALATASDLYTIDDTTGAGTSVGATGFALTGLAFRPSDSVLFGVTSNNSAANPRSLVTIDPVTGAGTLVGSLGINPGLADIAFRSDDTLYGYRPSTRTLYSVNTSTGAATQVSATAIPNTPPGPFGYGCSFDSTDNLFVFPHGTAGAFYLVDESTGGLTAQTALSGHTFANGIIVAAAFDQADLCWVGVGYTVLAATVYDVATVDTGASTIADVGSTINFLDALAWSLP